MKIRLILFLIFILKIVVAQNILPKSKHFYTNKDDNYGIGLTMSVFNTMTSSKGRYVVIDSSICELESDLAGGYSYGITINYFLNKYFGVISGINRNNFSVQNKYEYYPEIDKSDIYNPEYISIYNNYNLNSISIPFHLIFRVLKPFGITWEFGPSIEIPLSAKYDIEYTRTNQTKKVEFDDDISREYLKTSLNYDVKVGIHYKFINFDIIGKYGLTFGISQIIYNYNSQEVYYNNQYFDNVSSNISINKFEIQLGVLYYFNK
jgi:hypothetical protein